MRGRETATHERDKCRSLYCLGWERLCCLVWSGKHRLGEAMKGRHETKGSAEDKYSPRANTRRAITHTKHTGARGVGAVAAIERAAPMHNSAQTPAPVVSPTRNQTQVVEVLPPPNAQPLCTCARPHPCSNTRSSLSLTQTQGVEVLSRLQNAQPEYSYTLVLKKNGVRTPLPAVAQNIGA